MARHLPFRSDPRIDLLQGESWSYTTSHLWTTANPTWLVLWVKLWVLQSKQKTVISVSKPLYSNLPTHTLMREPILTRDISLLTSACHSTGRGLTSTSFLVLLSTPSPSLCLQYATNVLSKLLSINHVSSMLACIADKSLSIYFFTPTARHHQC